MRVLVVEDEEDTVAVFRDLLLEGGHAPVIVPSVDAALAHLEAAPPDAILLSLYFYFPGLSGLDFLRRRRVRRPDIPIIATSGFPTEGQARECVRLGVLDYIDKRASRDLIRELIAYLTVIAADQRLDVRGGERRRSARLSLQIPVRVLGASGADGEGESVDLSLFGMKVRPRRSLAPDLVAKLWFVPSDELDALEILAVPIREDSDGQCFRFVNLSETTFRRLRAVVRRGAEQHGPIRDDLAAAVDEALRTLSAKRR